MTSALSNGIRRAAARLSPDPTPDGELLSRFLTSRDEAAFDELVRRHGKMVFAACRRVLGNAADADDAFQAAFVVLVRKAHSLTVRACVGNFLYATAVLTARKARTMATRRRSNEAKATRPEADNPTGTDVELTRVLDDELAGLPGKYREPVVLCELEGVSRREAAVRLGIPEGTVSSRLATAHRMLQKRLAARGFAAVAVAAVLGKQASAVPGALADAAVRAAADGPPAGVSHLVSEVTKMLLWHKLRSGVTVLAGVALLLGVGMLLTGGPGATAAPVPKAAPEEGGLLWTYHCKTGELTAYTPAGEKVKTLKLQDGYRLRGMTPDGSKLVFIGRGGQLADAADLKPGLSIHLRAITESTEGADTGLTYTTLDQFHWSPDGKKVVRVSPQRGQLTKFVNTMIDLETKTETPIRLADDREQVLAWSPDGTWLLTARNTDTVKNGGVTYSLTEKSLFDLKAGTTTPLGEKRQLYNLVCSPDGRSLFGQAIETTESVAAGLKDLVMVRTDVATGKSMEVARHEDQSFATARWSPGGTRMAYTWYKRSSMGEAFLTVIDPDGKNPKTVTIPTPDETANELAFFGWFPDKPAAKPLASEKNDEPMNEKATKPEDAEQILGDRQEWKTEFLKAYALKDSELVKRIAPPYPDCRTDYFRDQFRRIHGRKPAEFELEGELNNFTVFNWKDGTCKAGWQTHTEPHVGVSLGFVFDTVLGISKSRIEVDGVSLNDKVTGDFVVRVGADREKMTAQLETILRKEVELPLKFTFKEVEEEVFVLSGKYAVKPLDGRKADEIEVYAVRLIDRKVGGGGSGDFQFMIDAIERHTGRPILLDKIDGLPKAVRWHFNFSDPLNKQVEAQERDAATLLENIAAQTGLKVSAEKRKLRKLFVEHAELKK